MKQLNTGVAWCTLTISERLCSLVSEIRDNEEKLQKCEGPAFHHCVTSIESVGIEYLIWSRRNLPVSFSG